MKQRKIAIHTGFIVAALCSPAVTHAQPQSVGPESVQDWIHREEPQRQDNYTSVFDPQNAFTIWTTHVAVAAWCRQIRQGDDNLADVIAAIDPDKIDTRGQGGVTPLLWLAYGADYETLGQLTNHGALPEATDHGGRTGLFYAVIGNNVEGIKFFVEHGIDPVQVYGNGITPLMMAARYGAVESIDYLLSQGARVETTDRTGGIALAYAVNAAQPNAVQQLLDAGSDVTHTDDHGINILTMARFAFNKPGGQETYQHVNESIRTPTVIFEENWMVQIAQAVRDGDIDDIRSLADRHKEELSTQGESGLTLLIWSVWENNPDALAALIEAGADVNQASQNGYTPVLYATLQGNQDIIRKLAEAGANLDQPENKAGVTSLMAAVRKRDILLVQLLTSLGADVNVQNAAGHSALHMAGLYNQEEIYQVIAESGGNEDLPDLAGGTPRRMRELACFRN